MTWKTRFVMAALLLFLFHDVAEATPPWYKSARWWLGEVAIAGSMVALAHSTVSRTSACGGCWPSMTAVKAKSGIAVSRTGIATSEITCHACESSSLNT